MKETTSSESLLATNMIMEIACVAPTENDFEEHEHTLSIDDICAIAALKPSRNYSHLDMSPEAISTKMIQLCINTLTLDVVTLEEQALGYFTWKKLKTISTWNEWKAGEECQIDKFMCQGMFGKARFPDGLPKNAVILQPHWQYVVKQSGVRRSRMCCNGSKKAVPQLHAIASTWSSCIELLVQRLFMGLCADMGLTIYGGNATDAYAHSPAPNDNYLAVDDAYADWYYKKKGEHISKRMVLPVRHALQGHPESGKMWMKMIDNILINQLGFRTTTHDCGIYIRERDGQVQLLLRQIDDFCTGITSEKTSQELFNDIGIKIQFPSKKEDGTIPFEFLGVISDYNGVDIIQNSQLH